MAERFRPLGSSRGFTLQRVDYPVDSAGWITAPDDTVAAAMRAAGLLSEAVAGLTPTEVAATRAMVSAAPAAFSSRALAAADNGGTLVVASAATATVNTGLPSGFGCTFVGAGAVSFAGTATVNDYRTTGAANPSCALIQTGADIYAAYGSKA